MKLYRFMSLKEMVNLEKDSLGNNDRFISVKSGARRGEVCFMAGNPLIYDADARYGPRIDALTPIRSLSSLGGVVNTEVLIEFDIPETEVRWGSGSYAEFVMEEAYVDKKDYLFNRVTNYWIDAFDEFDWPITENIQIISQPVSSMRVSAFMGTKNKEEITMTKEIKKEMKATLQEDTKEEEKEMKNNAIVKLTVGDMDGENYYFEPKGKTIKELREVTEAALQEEKEEEVNMNKSVKEIKELIALLNESTANDQKGGNEMIKETTIELTGVDNDGDKYCFKEKGKTIKELREEAIIAERKAMEFRETYEPEVPEEWELEQMRSREEAEAKAGTGYKKM